ncbi:L-dopachrome tautomerase yellow-f-like [Lutzomyia longipalpis]|uniref:L-dopachrome tautomerase yellow-f-like n=1 Tax=Lutzomyia longipalpis TaxID=7200 RepID=UPI002483AF8B|nr:L-dopachrome tautomerase yellow-f-like [Lutzomyia longipalpis]
MYYWKEIIYEDPPLDDNTLIGKYPYRLPYNNDVNGIEYHAQSGLMVTIVARIRPGVPSTLNAFCAADYDKGTSPHIWGFPNYQMNTLKASFYDSRSGRNLKTFEEYSAGYFNFFFANRSNEEDIGRKGNLNSYAYNNYAKDFSIVNTYYPNVDNFCNRLYIVDTGTLYYSPNEIYYVQNPAVLVFSLPSNGCKSRQFPIVHRVEIPNHLWKNPVGFVFITPDYQPKGSCDDVFLYIANIFDNSLIVYDYKRGDFWSFTDPSMKPVLAESNVSFKDGVYYIPLGISNVALGWPDKNGDRNAYFVPASSLAEYIVSTKVLKSSKSALYKDSSDAFTLIGYRGCNTETYKQVFDPTTGIISFGEMFSHKIRCWNTRLPLNPDTVGVVFESDKLLFVAEISVDSEEYLWFITNSLPYMFNTQDPLNVTEVNSRVFRVKVYDAIKGTVCDTSTLYH